MSIFGTIVNKLFGKAKPDEAPPAAEPSPDPALAQAAAPDAAHAAGPLADIDVAAVLDKLVSESGETLNWRTSIVDMLKALGIDSSLEHRRQLAQELKYDGDMNDSAGMNVWLHKQVMQALAANGGKLPSDLTA